MDLGATALFGLLLPSRTINTLPEEKNEYMVRSITVERIFNARSFDEFAVDFPERVSDGFGSEDFSTGGEECVRWEKFPSESLTVEKFEGTSE